MKIAIMQPYFLPYSGYFSLIKHTERFILLDTVQFIRHGWIERNRVLKEGEGWIYIKVPLLKASRSTLIKDTLIDNSTNWQQRIFSQIKHYKKIAPNYHRVISLLEDIFSKEFTSITELNCEALSLICNYLNISCQIDIFSELNLSIKPPTAPDEWALNICKEISSVDEYWNPIGGSAFFQQSKYLESGIKLKFHEIVKEEYEQKKSPFIPGLSIIDTLMFYDVETVNKMLDYYQLS